jgi:antitoxin component of MazEF toxin-antitoxin module
MRIKHRDVYTGRFFRSGNSHVIVIPPDLFEKIGLVSGDTVAMQYEHGLIWMARVTRSVLFDREQVSKIFDSLFPDKVDADASK